MGLFKDISNIKKYLYSTQEKYASSFSESVQELQIEMRQESEQEYRDLYARYKKNNSFSNFFILEELIDNKSLTKTQLKDFNSLVEEKILEVENTSLTHKDFFNIIMDYKKKI